MNYMYNYGLIAPALALDELQIQLAIVFQHSSNYVIIGMGVGKINPLHTE